MQGDSDEVTVNNKTYYAKEVFGSTNYTSLDHETTVQKITKRKSSDDFVRALPPRFSPNDMKNLPIVPSH
jgi:hypothetical protein